MKVNSWNMFMCKPSQPYINSIRFYKLFWVSVRCQAPTKYQATGSRSWAHSPAGRTRCKQIMSEIWWSNRGQCYRLWRNKCLSQHGGIRQSAMDEEYLPVKEENSIPGKESSMQTNRKCISNVLRGIQEGLWPEIKLERGRHHVGKGLIWPTCSP